MDLVTAVVRLDGDNTMTASIDRVGGEGYGEDEYRLTWAQRDKTWVETYDSLAVAIARLALLQHCEEQDWNAGFTSTAHTFAGQARLLFNAASNWAFADFVGWPREADGLVLCDEYRCGWTGTDLPAHMRATHPDSL